MLVTPRTAPSGSGSCRTASAALKDVYDRLGVKFDVGARRELLRPDARRGGCGPRGQGIAQVSEGATVVFVEGTKAPLIVRKSDGAYNYATTDLATIKYREETWKPDEVLYVVDHRQGDHFKLLLRRPPLRLRADRPRARRFRHDPGHGPEAVQNPGRRRASAWSRSWTKGSRRP